MGVLLKFRQKKIAIVADIESIFHQVRVPDKDRDILSFLWWSNGDWSQPPKEYWMTVQLFRATSSVSRWRNQKILEEYFDGSRIIEIPQDDRIGMASFHRLSEVMARDLGYDRPTYDISKHFGRFCDNLNDQLPPYVRIFVFVEGKKKTAVGCCLAEELTVASVQQHGYNLQRLTGGLRSLLSWRIQTGLMDGANASTASATEKSPEKPSFQLPLCGIRRLWVSPRHRRQKTATNLVDCVLKNLYYLTHLTREQVAFSEPTADGAGFAKSYTGREDFVIY
uniref:N-acetyltransferase ESCO1 n=1 Tax=Schistocephalus solidus TaxID=70667 RepID=A0A0X3P8M5_SCHSO